MRTKRQAIWLTALALLVATASHAQVTGEHDPQISDVERLRRTVAQLREQVLRPGAHVPGWDRGGVNPDADLRARGARNHYFVTRGRSGTSVGILTDRPISDFVPRGWRLVDRYHSEEVADGDPQLGFEALTARYAVAQRYHVRRRGDVDCIAATESAQLYEVPDAPSSPEDAQVPILFRLIMLALEGQEMCVRTEGDSARGYRGRFFRPDGHELPEMNDPDAITLIVPAAPIDTLIEPPPPEPSRVG